jgi:alkane 1-monooxygenase
MMQNLKYLIAYVAPLSAFLAVSWQGSWSFSTIIVAFVIIPLLEQVFTGTTKNMSEEEQARKSNSPLFDWLLYLNMPILFLLIYRYLEVITSVQLDWWEIIGLTLSVGIIVGTLGINVAHELGHRVKKHETLLAKLMLTTALYTHFIIEHNRGHHKWVATTEDPSTARKGESLYFFWFRSVFGVYLNAWKLELERLERRGIQGISLRNEMIVFHVMHLLYLALVWWLFGVKGMLFALLIAVIGILLLETVNYIEHYGLLRKVMPSGSYERVLPRHSWNSNHDLGRIFLYELTRHSDHHYKASRKYQVLRHFDESPQLPYGYPASMMMALIPPVWFRVMNDKVAALNQ